MPVDKIGIWDKIKHDFGLSHVLRMFIDFINRAEDAKNLFITSRLKNVKIGQNVIICNSDKTLSVQKGNISALAIPVEFV